MDRESKEGRKGSERRGIIDSRNLTWSRHSDSYSGRLGRGPNTADRYNRSPNTSSLTRVAQARVSLPSMASGIRVVHSTISTASQTSSFDFSASPSQPIIGGLLAPSASRTSGRSLAKTFSWRVNRHDTRLANKLPAKVAFKTSDSSWGPALDKDDLMPKDREELTDMYMEDMMQKMGARKRRESQGGHLGHKNLRAKLGFCALLRHDFQIWYDRLVRSTWDIPFFRQAINHTESHFGSSVVSLFVFTRWIFVLNLLLSILWTLLVVTPNVIYFPYTAIHKTFRFSNLIDGKGMLGETWMFYGHYPSTVASYHLDLAYLTAILLTYFGSLFVILRDIAKAKSMSQRGSIQNTRYKFALLLWTSWDYSLTSEDAIKQVSIGIANTIKDQMSEAKAKAAFQLRSQRQKTKVILLRILAWFLTIILIGGGCTGIIYLVMFVNFSEVLMTLDSSTDGTNTTSELSSASDGFLQVYGTTIIFSLINIFIPLIISKLPMIEEYSSGKAELSVTIARVFFLRMANLVALLVSLYNTVQHLLTEQSSNQSNEGTVSTADYGCTGTIIGQELYKLVIMDTIVHACVQLVLNFSKYFWTMNKNELNLPSAILVIIYRQALVWVGTLACPVMPVIGMASNCVFFLVNYLIVHYTCKPPTKRWNHSRHSTFFLKFLLFSLLLLIAPVSIILGSNDVIRLGSKANSTHEVPIGPFGEDMPTASFSGWRQTLPLWLQETFGWILSDTVKLPAFLILIIAVLYLRNKVNYVIQETIYLKADLQQEREDNREMARRVRFIQHLDNKTHLLGSFRGTQEN